MAIFNFWKRNGETETPAETPAETTPAEAQTVEADDLLLKALLAGEKITREQAMTIPAVSQSVNYIADTIASMPVKLYRYVESTGTVKSMDNDTRVGLLNGDTGDTLDAFQMKKAMVMDYLMGMGGYAYIRRYRNEVTGLFHVRDGYVSPQMLNADPIHKRWALFVYDKQYDLFEFIKLLRNTTNGATGVGLTNEVARALETAYKTLLYQLTSVSNGGNKKGFLKSQRKLGQEEINKLKRAWAQLYRDNTESVVVLNNGLEFQEASNSSVEMQLNQNKQTLSNEIKGIFHIYDNDYYRTFKEAIYPVIRAFETALNRDLLLEKEKKNYFFEFDVKETLRVNIKERYEAYKLAKETGFLTINEIRRAENLPRIDGMDVINVGLAAVLYDVNEHAYYTPNTDKLTSPEDGSSQSKTESEEDNHLLEEDINHEEYTQEQEDGNVE